MQIDQRLQNQYFYDQEFQTPQTPNEASMIPGAKLYQGVRKRFLKVEEVNSRRDFGRKRTNCEAFHALHRLPDVRVRECVQRNVPTRRDNFEKRLSRLAAGLKHLYPGEPAEVWHDAHLVWFFLAKPYGPKWTRGKVWERFQKAYRNSRTVPGGTLAEAVRRAGVGKDAARALCAASRFLKTRTPFVSCRTLAGWLGVSPATAARKLAALAASGSVRRTTGSGPHLYGRDADTYDVSPLFALCDRAWRRPTSFSSADLQLLSAFGPLGERKEEEITGEGETLLCLIPEGDGDPEEDRAFEAALDMGEEELNRLLDG